jgi:hypothetical protein
MIKTTGRLAAMKKIFVFFGVVIPALIAVGSARLATAAAKENAHGTESTQLANIASPPAPLPCGHGLAAQDLAGVCRSKPNPTPGALEAVGEPWPSEMKAQPKPGPKIHI